MVTIVTWYPDTCRCIVDYSVTDDVISFFCVQRVCDKHKSLASVEFRAEHENMKQSAKNVLNSILDNNIKSHDVRKAEFDDEEDFHLNTRSIQDHNSKCRRRYETILSRPHAFDSHIYETVRQENISRNMVD